MANIIFSKFYNVNFKLLVESGMCIFIYTICCINITYSLKFKFKTSGQSTHDLHEFI